MQHDYMHKHACLEVLVVMNQIADVCVLQSKRKTNAHATQKGEPPTSRSESSPKGMGETSLKVSGYR